MSSMVYKKRVFYAPKAEEFNKIIATAKAAADLLELKWSTESDAIQCWIGSVISIKERDYCVEIWMENGDLDILISHVVEFHKELLLRDISERLDIPLFDLRYRKNLAAKDNK